MLKGKKILLGITGSIAAYKAAILVRELIKASAEVRVIMTKSACSFITPLTLSTLSTHKVYIDFVDNEQNVWNSHVELGLWADLFVVAPASANSIAKFANGICDNLLSATYLSARYPVLVCPAMDLDMYQHPSVLNNLQKLKDYGNYILDAKYGELASGLIGQGRLAEPEEIVLKIKSLVQTYKPLLGKKVLITSGPTKEPIDPVRFISNYSTGKMGSNLAETAALLGAEVTLIAGNGSILPQNSSITIVKVTSAYEMYEKVTQNFDQQDICIFAAAVADYTPIDVSPIKIKKSDEEFSIGLTKTKDIAYEMGTRKSEGQILVGFALETNNELENAKSKLHKKNLDLVVLNSLNDSGSGFTFDTNKITIIDKKDRIQFFDLKAKSEVAVDIWDSIIDLL
ncbi:MAG: bifunctional phosphopantothenoylcysteine decarboxylase/phosphopantothenate--cysteine ligase CoaBC [Cytophagales bacterium]